MEDVKNASWVKYERELLKHKGSSLTISARRLDESGKYRCFVKENVSETYNVIIEGNAYLTDTLFLFIFKRI